MPVLSATAPPPVPLLRVRMPVSVPLRREVDPLAVRRPLPSAIVFRCRRHRNTSLRSVCAAILESRYRNSRPIRRQLRREHNLPLVRRKRRPSGSPAAPPPEARPSRFSRPCCNARRSQNGLPLHLTYPLAEKSRPRTTLITASPVAPMPSAARPRSLTSARPSVGRRRTGQLPTSLAWGDFPLLASVTDPNGGAWPLTRDNQGRVTSSADPVATL